MTPDRPVCPIDLFRVIVVVEGERTIQETVPFDRAPEPGETISIRQVRATVRHVIGTRRDGMAGIVLAWDGEDSERAPLARSYAWVHPS